MPRPDLDADVLVVGGGPAGLSAATWLGRYRRSTVVIDDGRPRNRWTDLTHGYLGADPVDPSDLLARAKDGLRQYAAVRLHTGRVHGVRPDGGAFVADVDGQPCRFRRVVLANGVADRFPAVDGFFDHYGTSVFHCPSCDGFEARGRPVVVLGWDEHVAGFAAELTEWAAAVTVVTDGRQFEADGEHRRWLADLGVEVVEEGASRFVGDPGVLEAVALDGGRDVPAEMAFFSIAHDRKDDLADPLGCERTDEDCLVVDADQQTTVEGVYAAGDVTPGPQLVQVAAAKGTVAGVACAMSLQRRPVARLASPERG
jgi:thioredoxin reductase